MLAYEIKAGNYRIVINEDLQEFEPCVSEYLVPVLLVRHIFRKAPNALHARYSMAHIVILEATIQTGNIFAAKSAHAMQNDVSHGSWIRGVHLVNSQGSNTDQVFDFIAAREEILNAAGPHHAPAVQHILTLRQLQRDLEILLDQQDAHAF